MIRNFIAALIFGLLLACLAAYIGLVRDGTVAPPSGEVLRAFFTGATSTITILAVAAIAFLALCAPLIFAIRSGDALTIVVSLILLATAWIAAYAARTTFDLIIAVLLFTTNLIFTAVVYGATVIRDTLRGSPTP